VKGMPPPPRRTGAEAMGLVAHRQLWAIATHNRRLRVGWLTIVAVCDGKHRHKPFGADGGVSAPPSAGASSSRWRGCLLCLAAQSSMWHLAQVNRRPNDGRNK
jgi:hypothetical protein